MSSVTKASLFGLPWGGLQFGDGLFGGHCLGASGPGLEAGHHGFEQGGPSWPGLPLVARVRASM